MPALRRHPPRVARLLASALIALLAGCASVPHGPEDWPRAIPPRAHYEALYAADAARGAVEPIDEYLVWVERFYTGFGPFPYGWNAMSDAAMHDLDEAERARVTAKLDHLGQLISGEWAKSRARTRIPNRALSAWAQAMNEAIDRGEVEALLDRALVDVEAILAGRLDADAITLGRYFPDAALDEA